MATVKQNNIANAKIKTLANSMNSSKSNAGASKTSEINVFGKSGLSDNSPIKPNILKPPSASYEKNEPIKWVIGNKQKDYLRFTETKDQDYVNNTGKKSGLDLPSVFGQSTNDLFSPVDTLNYYNKYPTPQLCDPNYMQSMLNGGGCFGQQQNSITNNPLALFMSIIGGTGQGQDGSNSIGNWFKGLFGIKTQQPQNQQVLTAQNQKELPKVYQTQVDASAYQTNDLNELEYHIEVARQEVNKNVEESKIREELLQTQETKKGELRSESETQKANIEKATSDIKAAESEKSSAQGNLTSLESQKSQIEADGGDTSSIDSQIQEAKNKITECDEKIKEATKRKEEATAARDKAETDLRQCLADIVNLTNEKAAYGAAIQESGQIYDKLIDRKAEVEKANGGQDKKTMDAQA